MSNPLLSAHYLESKRLISEELQRGVESEYLSTRPGPGGRSVSYIEANRVIDLANRIFGYDGWSSTIISTTEDYFDRDEKGTYSVGIATVMRVVLRSGAYREDVGYGTCIGRQKGEVLEKARKESATDALKRALRLFGNRLGNSLYNKEYVSEAQQDRNTNPTKGSGISHAHQPSARTYAYQPYQPNASPLPSNDHTSMMTPNAGATSTTISTSTSASTATYAPYTPGTGNGAGTGTSSLHPQLTQLPAPTPIPTPIPTPVPVPVPVASGAPLASLTPLIVPPSHPPTHSAPNAPHTQHTHTVPTHTVHTAVSPAVETYNTRKRQRVDDDRSPDSWENQNSGGTGNSVSGNALPAQTYTPVQTRGYTPVLASAPTHSSTHSEGLTSTGAPQRTPTDANAATATAFGAGAGAGVASPVATIHDTVHTTAPPARTYTSGAPTTAAPRAYTPVATAPRPASTSMGRINSLPSSSTPSRSTSIPSPSSSPSPAVVSASMSSSSSSSSVSTMSLNARYSAQLAQVPAHANARTPAPAHTAADAQTPAQVTTQPSNVTVTTSLPQSEASVASTSTRASVSTSTSAIVAAPSTTAADMDTAIVAPTNMTTAAAAAPIVENTVAISASTSTTTITMTTASAANTASDANTVTSTAPATAAGAVAGISGAEGAASVRIVGGIVSEEQVSSGDTSLVATQPDTTLSQPTSTGTGTGTGTGTSAIVGTMASTGTSTGVGMAVNSGARASIAASPARTAAVAAPRAQNMYRGRRALYSSAPPVNPAPGEGEDAS